MIFEHGHADGWYFRPLILNVMLMKSEKIVVLAVLALLPFVPLKAQEGGQWGNSVEVELAKKLYKGVNLSFAEEFRTRANFGTVDRFSHTLGLDYQLCSYVKLGGAYSLISYNHPIKDWEIRYRYYFYATGIYSFGGFTFSLRERYQSTYREDVAATAKRANPKLYLRSRFLLGYDIPNTSLKPYASVELFNSLNNPQGDAMDQVRLVGGVEYKINKRNALDLYYRYANKIDEDASIGNLIGIGYTHKF
jgi:hypothetical protein